MPEKDLLSQNVCIPARFIANLLVLCYTFSGGKMIHTSFVASHFEVGLLWAKIAMLEK
jgi:hypothetical protein